MTDPEHFEDRRETIVPKPNTLPYIVAVIAVEAIAIIAVAAVQTLRAGDNTLVITAIIGLAQPTVLSLLAFMKSQETHLSVNSRLDAFMAAAKLAARVRGIEEGRAEGREQADKRTDMLRRQADDTAIIQQDVAAQGPAPIHVVVDNTPLETTQTKD